MTCEIFDAYIFRTTILVKLDKRHLHYTSTDVYEFISHLYKENMQKKCTFAISRVHFRFLVTVAGDESIVFPDTVEDKTSSPQTKRSSNHEDNKTDGGAKRRFGLDTGGASSSFNFGFQPNGGGISGSASFSSAYGGQGHDQGHSGSQSQSFNFQAGSNGFSASQAASQSSSFNSQFPAHYGYEVRNLSRTCLTQVDR
jgi:hypothetical protein